MVAHTFSCNRVIRIGFKYKRVVDRKTFFRAVDKAGVTVGKLAQAQPDMRGGAAATMLAMITLTILDGKPLTGTQTIQASNDEIIMTVNRILEDEDYQLGPEFPFTIEEMRAEIARENALNDPEPELDQEGHEILSQAATQAEKIAIELGKTHSYKFDAGEACTLLAICVFTLLNQEANVSIPNDIADYLLPTIAKEILEEEGYQPSPAFPFTKEEMDEATEHANALKIEQCYIK
ncbi:MAG TPA: hypothetical protein VGM01_01835, partial [Ktedonobacteraceae bacterium]